MLAPFLKEKFDGDGEQEQKALKFETTEAWFLKSEAAKKDPSFQRACEGFFQNVPDRGNIWPPNQFEKEIEVMPELKHLFQTREWGSGRTSVLSRENTSTIR